MNVKELKSDGLKKSFQITISSADFENKVDAKVTALGKTTKLPGFRPGKAPKAMLMQKFRPAVLGEVLDDMVNASVNEVLTSKKLIPAMTPDVKLDKFEEGKDISFEMNFEVLPEIKVGDLKTLKLEKPVAEVPQEEIDKAMKFLAQSRRNVVKVESDRASKKGDTVVIDFVGSVDGVEFQGGKGENYPLELGSGSFIPGFEDQLIGKKAGDKVDVKVKFPDNYHAKDLAGKDSVFAVEIKELREAKKVEINDEFAKSMGEDSLDKLKETIKARIQSDYDAASRMKLKRHLLDILDKEYKFDVPQGLVDAEYKAIVDQYNNAKKYNQLDEEEKAKPEDKLMEEYKEIAVRRVKLGLLLSEIGKAAKITITPEDINKAIMNEAKKYPGQEKAVFDFYLKNKQAIESLKAPVMEEKIVDHIFSQAAISEKIVSIEDLYNFNEGKASKAAKSSKAKSETKSEEKTTKAKASKKSA